MLKKYAIWIVLFLTLVGVRFFVWELFYIPSRSMSPSLLPGDIVLMNKLRYGLRKPFSSGGGRTWGYDQPQRGDVLFFNWPVGDSIMSNFPKNSYYELIRHNGRDRVLTGEAAYGQLLTHDLEEKPVFIKRCIALPGDSVQVYDNEVLLNEQMKLEGYDYTTHTYQSDFSQVSAIYEANRDDLVFPHSDTHRWNFSIWGPLYVPQKGDTIPLDRHSLQLYKRIIEVYENNEITLSNDHLKINNVPSDEYIVKQDYYVVLGDNHLASDDSRFWGFVPADHIIGKATTVLFSFHDGAFHWSRVLKKL